MTRKWKKQMNIFYKKNYPHENWLKKWIYYMKKKVLSNNAFAFSTYN